LDRAIEQRVADDYHLPVGVCLCGPATAVRTAAMTISSCPPNVVASPRSQTRSLLVPVHFAARVNLRVEIGVNPDSHLWADV